MSSKTIKTILFASLIVAMVLPFSGMDYATAEKQTTDQEKLQELKQTLKAKLKETSDKDEKKDLKLVIKRLNLMVKLLDLRENPSMNTEVDIATTSSLLEEIQATFDESVGNSLNESTPIDILRHAPDGIAENFQTTTQTKFNCYYNSNPTGFNWGTIVGVYSPWEFYLVAYQGYPSSIAILEGTSCEVKDFDYGYVNFRSLATGQMCSVNFTYSTDAESGYCWQFGTGTPVLITANASYDVGIPFSATEGWDFVWVP